MQHSTNSRAKFYIRTLKKIYYATFMRACTRLPSFKIDLAWLTSRKAQLSRTKN